MREEPIELSASARRVQQALDRKGVQLEVVELPASTRTASDAAQAVGCEVGQIAKSLIFKKARSREPILVIASGANRVDESLIEGHVGEDVLIADADFVRETTGFAIGGVPPVGHLEELETIIDADLFAFDQIWAAAGTPHAVFRLQSAILLQITDGQVTRID